MDAESFVDQFLKESKVMQIATVHEGKPWICTVNFAVDEDHHLYWMSLRSTHHSQHVREFPFVAGTIVKDADKGQGLQFEGKAEEVAYENLEKANEVYEKRYGHKADRLEEARSGDGKLRTYYKVTPTRFIVFDKVNLPNLREEFML